MNPFKPEDNITVLLNKLEEMWALDRIVKCDRAKIFKKCVNAEIKKVIQIILEQMLDNYDFFKRQSNISFCR